MQLKRMGWYGVFAIILLLTPLLATVQPQWQPPPP
jgi:hypothetical protein